MKLVLLSAALLLAVSATWAPGMDASSALPGQTQPRGTLRFRDGDVPHLSVAGMSKCPDTADWVIQSQWLFASIAQHLPMTWELDWVAKEVADGEFECMHGDTECAGNVWASCLLEETDIPKWAPGQYGAWWSMVSETYKDIPENMYAAALNYFLDAATADECAHSDLGKQVMSAAVARAEGVRWAPSIFVNGELACEWNGGDCPAGATQESWTEWICGFYAADDLPPGCV